MSNNKNKLFDLLIKGQEQLPQSYL